MPESSPWLRVDPGANGAVLFADRRVRERDALLEVFDGNDQVILKLIAKLTVTTSHSVTRFVTRNEPKTTKSRDGLRRYEN